MGRKSGQKTRKAMKDITLVCVDAGGGHACGLSLGLRKYCNLTTVFKNPNVHGLDHIEQKALFGFDKLFEKFMTPGGDELIIMSVVTLIHLENHMGVDNFKSYLKNWGVVKIIITDGTMVLDPDKYNKKMKGMEVFATMCKIALRGDLPTKEYYQPFDLSHVEIKKNNKLTIAHSPWVPSKAIEKGTCYIKEGIESYSDTVVFDIITNTPWEDALKRKAKSHIFIDQIFNKENEYRIGLMNPGMGKSGIEAMHLESLVITRGQHKPREIPSPPIVWIGDQSWTELLDYYIHHPEERLEKIAIQKAWALKYATHDFAARNVLGI